MITVKDILESWFKMLNPTKEQKQTANERFYICEKCEHNIELKCSKCGCPLKAKIFSQKGCPLNKW
jgi:hypothetical protein